jgi:hypothetical protein
MGYPSHFAVNRNAGPVPSDVHEHVGIRWPLAQ